MGLKRLLKKSKKLLKKSVQFNKNVLTGKYVRDAVKTGARVVKDNPALLAVGASFIPGVGPAIGAGLGGLLGGREQVGEGSAFGGYGGGEAAGPELPIEEGSAELAPPIPPVVLVGGGLVLLALLMRGRK